MNIINFTVLAVIIVIISSILQRCASEYCVLFICGSCIVLILILIPQIKKILNEIDLIFKISNFPNGTREILLKVLGICLLTQFGADFCRSREEIAISNKVELAGKIAAILAALPLFKSVIEIALNFLKN